MRIHAQGGFLFAPSLGSTQPPRTALDVAQGVWLEQSAPRVACQTTRFLATSSVPRMANGIIGISSAKLSVVDPQESLPTPPGISMPAQRSLLATDAQSDVATGSGWLVL